MPADAAGLSELLSRVFSPAVGALVRWKYLENPALSDPLIAVAQIPSGELVGCYPLLGRRFWHGGREVLAVLGADLAVLPDYRTGGELHRRLCDAAQGAALERGAAFAYGFPNHDAYRLSKRWFGLRDWTTLEAWTLRLRRWPGLGFSKVAPLAPAGRVTPKGAWAGLESFQAGAGVRSREFFEWRFADPEKYRLRRGADPRAGEYLVVCRNRKSASREAVVVDFGPAASATRLEQLLEAEIEHQKKAAAQRLVLSCLPDSAMARAVRRCGFRRGPERDRKVTVKALAESFPAVPSHLTLADADDP